MSLIVPPQVLNKDAIILEPRPHHTLLASYIGRLKLRKKWTTLTCAVKCRTLFAISGLSTFLKITIIILLKFTDRHLGTYEGEFEFKSI